MRKETLEKKGREALTHIKDVLAYVEKKVERLEGMIAEDPDGTKNTRWDLMQHEIGVRYLKLAKDFLIKFMKKEL